MRKRKFSKVVGVLLSDHVYEKLVQVTNQKEIPMSEYIRRLIENDINREEKTNNE